MKICVLGTRGFPHVQGGVEKHCEQLYPLIARHGHEVTVFTRLTYVDPALTEYQGVRLTAVANPARKSLEAIVHTARGVFAARRAGCDVLHIHAIGPALCVPLARLLGLRVVMTNHGPDYDRQKWGRLAKTMLRLGESLGSRFANQVISISRPIARNIKDRYKRDAVIIPNGVVVPQIMAGTDALAQYGLEKGRYILAVGRFVPEKGFHDLIQAFGRARANAPGLAGWRLVIVGDADHEDDYSRGLRAQSQGAADVVLTGRLTGRPLQELYSHAGLFVLPSYHEGLPIVLLEAMSYGLSCIVSNIPANREVALGDERCFSPGDIAGMAAKIAQFAARPLDADQRASQVAMIKENYDWDRIAVQTLGVYEGVIAASAPVWRRKERSGGGTG